MARQLNTHVHAVQRGEDGSVANAEQFAAGTYEADLPDWAREAINNPDVWDGTPDRDSRRRSPQQGNSESPAGGNAGSTAGDSAPAPAVPPMGGPGGSTEAWAEYARANGIQVDEGTKRGDIIDQLRAAGVPVE